MGLCELGARRGNTIRQPFKTKINSFVKASYTQARLSKVASSVVPPEVLPDFPKRWAVPTSRYLPPPGHFVVTYIAL